MAKKFYSDFVDHCLKYYVRYPEQTEFKTETDRANWQACDAVLRSNEKAREVINALFLENRTVNEGVEECASRLGLTVTAVYATVRSVEHEIAIKRGLV